MRGDGKPRQFDSIPGYDSEPADLVASGGLSHHQYYSGNYQRVYHTPPLERTRKARRGTNLVDKRALASPRLGVGLDHGFVTSFSFATRWVVGKSITDIDTDPSQITDAIAFEVRVPLNSGC